MHISGGNMNGIGVVVACDGEFVEGGGDGVSRVGRSGIRSRQRGPRGWGEERRQGERVDLILCRNPRDILAGRDAQAKGTRDARRIRRYRNQIKSRVQSPTRPGLYTRGNQYSRTGLVRPGRMRAGLESPVGRREGS